MNSGRRQRPTLWKIPLFTSAYASLARLKERSPSRSHGSVSMERSPVFHPIVSSRSPLIVSAPPAEIKLSDGTFVSAPLSLFPFCLSSFSRLAHTHPPTHPPLKSLSACQQNVRPAGADTRPPLGFRLLLAKPTQSLQSLFSLSGLCYLLL